MTFRTLYFAKNVIFHHDWTNVKTRKSSRPDYSIRVDDSNRPNDCSRPNECSRPVSE